MKTTSNERVYAFRGLSKDKKPTKQEFVGNGSIFLEMDTGKYFIFDEEHNKWLPFTVSGGGGGVDPEAEILDTNVILSEDLYCYVSVGNIKDASPTHAVKVGSAGDSIRDVFEVMFGQRDQQPTIVLPTILLRVGTTTSNYAKNFNTKAEIGTSYTTMTYSVSISAGSYSYGPETGVTWSDIKIKDSKGNVVKTITPVAGTNTYSGTLPITYKAGDAQLSFTVEGSYSAAKANAKTLVGKDSGKKISANTSDDSATFHVDPIKYTFALINTSTDVPTTTEGATKLPETFATAGADVSYEKGKFLWFLTPSETAVVQTELMGVWGEVTSSIEHRGKVSLLLDSGVEVDYYAHILGVPTGFRATGSTKYCVGQKKF